MLCIRKIYLRIYKSLYSCHVDHNMIWKHNETYIGNYAMFTILIWSLISIKTYYVDLVTFHDRCQDFTLTPIRSLQLTKPCL